MTFLSEALLFLLAAIITVPVCKRLGLSSVLGYLAAGLLIGPYGIGFIGEAEEVLHFAEIGVVLLLFVIGLELQPRRLWVMRRAVFGLGTAQVLCTTLTIAAVLLFGFHFSVPASLLLGFSLALSSTAFVLQLLGEQGKLNKPHGRAAFGVLLMQDVAVIPAIALLNFLTPAADGQAASLHPWLLLIILAGLVLARFSLRPVLRFIAGTGIHELFAAAGLALVVGAALAMNSAGLSMGLGAFIAGMMVADSEYRHQLETDVMPFKGLLLGLFFMAVGMSANLALLGDSPLTVIGLVLALVFTKAAVLLLLAFWYGLEKGEAWRGALLLSQGGEFAFVLLVAGAGAAVISDQVAEMAVLVVTLSMATTPLLVALVDRLKRTPVSQRPEDKIDVSSHPVVIAGFGRFGQILGRVLSMRNIPFTALEANPRQVDFVRRYGHQVYYGDASRLDLLYSAHVAEASALILAIGNIEVSLKIAEMVGRTWPNVRIFARARNRHHEMALRKLGVHYVIRETLMSSLAMTEKLLTHIGLPEKSAKEAVATFKSHDHQTLLKQAALLHDQEAYDRATMTAAEELRALFREDASSSGSEEADREPEAGASP